MSRSLLVAVVMCGLASTAMSVMQGSSWTSGAVVDKYGMPTKHAHLKCWLNDDVLQAHDSNTLISGWADSSEADQACNFQAVGGAQPYVKRNAVNGHHVLRFTHQLNSALRNTDAAFESNFLRADPIGNNMQPSTTFVVARVKTLNSVLTGTPLGFRGATPSSKIVAQFTGSNAANSAVGINVKYHGNAAMTAGSPNSMARARFHIIALRQDLTPKATLFMDGTTSGGYNVNTPDSPKIDITGSAQQIWLGQGQDNTENFDGDIAEVLMYDASLTDAEVDRIGNYLARKFDVIWSFQSSSATQSAFGSANPLSLFPAEAPVVGGQVTITGNRLLPYDTNADGKGSEGDAATDNDIRMLTQILMVSVAQRLPVCRQGVRPSASTCAAPSRYPVRVEKECTNPTIRVLGDAINSGADRGASGEIRCDLPDGAATELQQQLLIRWAGIEFAAPNFNYKKATVDDIRPKTVSYKGGDTITLTGSNFASGNTWFSNQAIWATGVEVATIANTRVQCASTKFVSSAVLECVTPALPPAKYKTDKKKSKNIVSATVNVRLGNLRTAGRAAFEYNDVPSFYSCFSKVKSDCVACCPESCVTDVFVKSAYETCIAECNAYCGMEVKVDCGLVPTPTECFAPVENGNALLSEAVIAALPPTAQTKGAASTSRVGNAVSYSPKQSTWFVPQTYTIIGFNLNSKDIVKAIDATEVSCGGEDPKFGSLKGGDGVNIMAAANGLSATVSFTFAEGTARASLCYLAADASNGFQKIGAGFMFVSNLKPAVRAILPRVSPVTGGSSVTVVGRDLGAADSSIRFDVGGTVCEAVVWHSDESVTCKVPAGGSIGLACTATVTQQTDTRESAAGYVMPILSSVVHTNLASSSSISLTLVGSNFGAHPVAGVNAATASFKSQASTSTWVSDTSMVAMPSPGSPGQVAPEVDFGDQNGKGRPWVSFDIHMVSSVARGNSPQTGGASLTLTGDGLGQFDPSVHSNVGSTHSMASTWVSESSVMIKFPTGAGNYLDSVVSINAQAMGMATTAKAFSFDKGPSFPAKTMSGNIPATGATSVTVVGAAFSRDETSGTTRFGGSAAESSSWVSETATVGKAHIGRVERQTIIVTDTLLAGSVSNYLSFDVAVPMLDPTGHSNAPATGAVSVTLVSANLGSSQSTLGVSIDMLTNPATNWMSTTSVVSKLRSGSATTNGLDLTVKSAGAKVIAAPITFDSQHNAGSVAGFKMRFNSPTTGTSILTVVGQDFGSSAGTAANRIGMSGAESTWWNSDSALKSRATALSGTDQNAKAVASTIIKQVSTTTQTISYDIPAVAGQDTRRHPYTGATSMSLVGSGFGERTSPSVRAAGTTAEAVAWVSASTMRAKMVTTTLLQQDYAAVVTINQDRGTRVNSVLYDWPRPMNSPGLLQAVTPATGATSVTVLGADFGGEEHAASHSLTFGDTSSECSTWVADSTILGKISIAEFSNVDGGLGIVVTVGQYKMKETLSRAMTYAKPTFINPGVAFTRSNAPSTGATSVTLIGNTLSNFGASPASSAQVRVGETGAAATEWVSDTGVNIKHAGGVDSGAEVILTLGLNNMINTGAIGQTSSYDHVDVKGGNMILMTANGPTTGDMSMTLIGASFQTTMCARVGVTATSFSMWMSDSAVQCRVPAAGKIVSTGSVAATGGRRMHTLTSVFTHDTVVLAPFANSVVCNGAVCQPATKGPSNGPSTGQFSMTIVGANLGGAQPTAIVPKTGKSVCDMAVWMSHSSFKCKAPAGVGMSLDITVTMDDVNSAHARMSTAVAAYTYDLNRMTALAAATRPGTGSSSVTLIGHGIGQDSYTTDNRVGFSASEVSEWHSDTALLVKLSQGLGDSQMPIVSTTGPFFPSERSGSITHIFQYTASASKVMPNSPATGANSVTLVGNSFGRGTQNSLKVNLGSTGTEATMWSSDSSMLTKSAYHSSGEDSWAVVSIVSRTFNALGAFSVNDPSATQLGDAAASAAAAYQSNAASTGAMSVTLVGASIGRVDYTASKRVASTHSETSRWVSDSAVVSKAPSGERTMGEFTVSTSKTHKHTLTNTFSFNGLDAATAPMLANGRYNAAASGSVSLTIVAQNIAAQSSSARIGGTHTTASTWVSDTSLTAKNAGATGSAGSAGGAWAPGFSAYGFAVTVHADHGAHAVGTMQHLFSVDASVVTAVSTVNGPTSGDYWIYIQGANMGEADYTKRAGLGNSDYGGAAPQCNAGINVVEDRCNRMTWSTWVSDTTLRVKMRSGDETGLGIFMMGDPIHGAGAALQLKHGELTNTFTFDLPVITGTWSQTNLPATGATSMTVIGNNFGRDYNLVTEAETGLSLFLKGREINHAAAMQWLSSTAIVGHCPPGHGGELSTSVKRGTRTGTVFTKHFTYNTPEGLSTTASGFPAGQIFPATNLPASTGATSVTLVGQNFNGMHNLGISNDPAATMLENQDGSGRMRFGGSAAEATTWVSDSSTKAKISGSINSMNRELVMSNEKRSRTAVGTYSYDAAALYDLSVAIGGGGRRNNEPTTGSASLTLVGMGYPGVSKSSGVGQTDSSARVRIFSSGANNAAEATNWVSDSSVKARPAAGGGAGKSIRVSAGAIFTAVTLTRAISFDLPMPTNTLRTNAAATGGSFVTVFGKNLGTGSESPATRLTNTGAEMATWFSDSSVVVKVPSSTGLAGVISVSAGVEVRGTRDGDWSFDRRPVMPSRNAPASGALSVTLVGSGQGVGYADGSSSSMFRLGVTCAESTMWVADSSITIKASQGVGHQMVSATVAMRVEHETVMSPMSYDGNTFKTILEGRVMSFAHADSAHTGASSVTLVGAQFGGSDQSARTRVSGGVITSTNGIELRNEAHKWQSDTDIVVKAAATQKSGKVGVVATVSRKKGTSASVFEYHNPQPTAILATNTPTSGKASITLYGDNFATADETQSVRHGGTTVEASSWVSVTSMVVKMPAMHFDTVAPMVLTQAALFLGTGGNAWSSWPVSYDTASTSSAVRTNTPLASGTSLTLIGFNMLDDTMTLRVGNTAAEEHVWVSTSSLTIKSASHSNLNSASNPNYAQIIISTRHKISTMTNMISYDLV